MTTLTLARTETRPETRAPDPLDDLATLRSLDDDALRSVADRLREETIAAVSETGGHLGSGLGVVELTVAIHAVFETPRDALIWDVGHQCYPHKILTGRRDRIRTLRQGGGLSGFTKRDESAYDPFGAAHSSTAMSAGLGFAEARRLSGKPGAVVCVVGDGAMSAGMAYEALNNAGDSDRPLIVILNDNDMSIAPPVGALARHLRGLRGGGTGSLFAALGFDYRGPVDGHDLPALLATLRDARDHAEGPVLIHALTRKGAGFAPAEAAADKYHGVARFDVVSGKQRKSAPKAPAYTKVFGRTLTALAERDPRLVAITAAMPSGCGVDLFAERFPERAFDVGIAEQHAVTFAAGLAAEGMRPFCAIYSTFLQRAYDQIVHDVALQGLPVRFAIDRAGLVGADGPTHAGSFDIGYLGALPGFTVMAAADEAELARMVATAAAHDSGPIAFRYPRGEGRGVPIPDAPEPLEIGRGRVLREGRHVALLCFGARMGACLEAAETLAARGVSATVADARFAKPLDRRLIRDLLLSHELVLTIEEGAQGGFGAQVAGYAMDAGLLDGAARLRSLTLPDRFIAQDSADKMYAQAGLGPQEIAARALDTLERGAPSAARCAAAAGARMRGRLL